MKYQITLLLFFLASLALGQEKTIIFSGVNIIDAESGTIKNNQHVVIQKGMIQAIESKIASSVAPTTLKSMATKNVHVCLSVKANA